MARDNVIGIDDVTFHKDGPLGFPVLRFTFEPCREEGCGNCLGYIEDPGAGDRLDWQCDCDEHEHFCIDCGREPVIICPPCLARRAGEGS
jgi:hypothetical protein